MSQTTPLVARQASDPIAYITQNLASLEGYKGIVRTDTFLSHVQALANQLPEKKHIINLCGNRYHFMVSICAAVLRKQINLLPPNKNIATQRRLSERYEDAYVLHDGIDVDPELLSVDLQEIVLTSDGVELSSTAMPEVPLEQLALISFTSGSTGDSKPNEKTWRTLTDSTAINRRYMLPDNDKTYHILATVPGQHMWGLETSVLMALFSKSCVVDSKPLFPSDIQSTLAALPEPRALISTPVHLRSLAASDLQFSKTEIVLCATSPLTQTLAQDIERVFEADLHEVYGCSEVGSMALRKTAKEQEWQKFEGIHFEESDNQVLASTDYLPIKIALSDKIAMDDTGRFKLLGRSSDMVDIAGKRGSLAEINTVLLQFEGLLDGVVIFPEQDRAVPRLAAMVVLKGGYSGEQLKAHFREYLDSVFVPRPIFYLDALPREENGKLPRKKVDALYAQLTTKKV